MTKEEIKKLLEDSKKVLAQDYENFEKSIKEDLKNFKKKTLDQIWLKNTSWFKYGTLAESFAMKPLMLLLLTTMMISISGLVAVAYAQEEAGGGSDTGAKLIGAGIAFGVAAGGAGVGLGYVGSAGLAVISENPAFSFWNF